MCIRVSCKPEINIHLASTEPVLTGNQLQSSNFAAVTAGSMFATPESWTMSNAAGYNYVAAMSLPFYADVRTFSEYYFLFLTFIVSAV